jgi:cytochrome b pre-mRNA-processing protein 3
MSSRQAAALLYNTVVAVARDPFFYRELAVPDTIEGRYEMIVLHVALLLRRLRDPQPVGRRRGRRGLAQAVVDYMAADLDRSMREIGVGDLSLARYMKNLGEGLYGRAAAYDAALDQGGAAMLATALLRNVYAGQEPGGHILAVFADYVGQQDSYLKTQHVDLFALGKIELLAPTECSAPC